MSETDTSPSQLIGETQTRAIQEALKPRLRAAGVTTVETRIGKPPRFFENIRQRGSLRVRDLLATCAASELDPVEFIREALGDKISPEIRPPRIVSSAWRRLSTGGPGLGKERLAELESLLQLKPRQARTALGKEIGRAARDELPRVLGLYGSCYRVESDLARAKVVLQHAREMARELRLPATEADLLIRMAYVALERDRLGDAMRRAEQATVISARFDDRESQGISFLAMGMFRYYSQEYRKSLEDFEAALRYSTTPRQRIAAHQCSAHCLIRLNREDEARHEIESAREFSPHVASWMEAKLSWTEARLTYGTERLDHLKTARDALSRKRPADCALVTVELIEEALSMGRDEIAEREALRLCALVKKTGSPRVERAILHLTLHHTRLTPDLVTKMRQAVDAAQARRFSRLIGSDH